MPSIAFDIISYATQLFLFYYYMLIMSQITQNTKHNWKIKLLILATAFIMMISAILLRMVFPLNTLALSLIMFLSLSFIVKLKKSKAAIISILIPMFLIISEILLVALFSIALDKTAVEMIQIPWASFAISIGTSLLLIISILIFSKILINKQKIKSFISNFNHRYLKLTIYLLLFTIVPHAFLIPFNIYSYNPLFLLLNFVNLFAISIFLFWYISNFLEKEKIQEQVATLEMDNKTLEGMVDGVRTIKHDFNNIFQAINGYICSKQYDELEQYVLKIMNECSIVNTLSIINKQVFDDPANYGVIGSKYFIATEQNITMDLDVSVSFKDINFSMAELSRIFGILLDNAIEATNKCSNKYIRLEIKYVPKKNATVIRVINTYNQTIQIDLSSIYHKGYSSKQIKSGIGLWEASKLIAKHKHVQMYASIEKDKFIQNIIIENT